MSWVSPAGMAPSGVKLTNHEATVPPRKREKVLKIMFFSDYARPIPPWEEPLPTVVQSSSTSGEKLHGVLQASCCVAITVQFKINVLFLDTIPVHY